MKEVETEENLAEQVQHVQDALDGLVNRGMAKVSLCAPLFC
jgi:hypothetical protein